jgi:uncharacterized protein (TIGR03435 family)
LVWLIPAFFAGHSGAWAQRAPASPAPGAQAAARSQDASPLPEFEVAAIHQHIPELHEHNSIWSSTSDSHFKAENVSLIGLIHWAYEMPETRILNAPGWASSTYFNIDASSDASVDAKMAHLTPEAGKLQKEMMVRALLADRFKLVTHTETRELPVYELIVAKGTPKLGDDKSNGTTINHGRDHIEVQASNSVAFLAEELAKEVGRPVVDETGISGRYNLKVRWTPDVDAASTSSSAPDAPPSIFTALEEQLGLKLRPGKGPVEVLVVDHTEMPSEN